MNWKIPNEKKKKTNQLQFSNEQSTVVVHVIDATDNARVKHQHLLYCVYVENTMEMGMKRHRTPNEKEREREKKETR